MYVHSGWEKTLYWFWYIETNRNVGIMHIAFIPRCVVLLLGIGVAVSGAGPVDSLSVTELRGTAQTNRPFTISRVFAQGEITGYPQPVVAGAPASSWQADVKTRWPDGSVQHALVSFFASLGANASLTVTFVNTASDQTACAGATLTFQLSTP